MVSAGESPGLAFLPLAAGLGAGVPVGQGPEDGSDGGAVGGAGPLQPHGQNVSGLEAHNDRLPELHWGVAVALLIGERARRAGPEVTVEIAVDLVLADHVANRAGDGFGLLRFCVGALPLRFGTPVPMVFLACQLEVLLGGEVDAQAPAGPLGADGRPFVVCAVRRVFVDAGLDVDVCRRLLLVPDVFRFHVVHRLHNRSLVTVQKSRGLKLGLIGVFQARRRTSGNPKTADFVTKSWRARWDSNPGPSA